MDPFLKKNIALAAGILLVIAAYAGNYLPLRKSMAFINANREVAGVSGLNELLDLLAEPLKMSSPIGQQELTRNTANMVYNLIRSENGKNPAITQALTGFVNEYYEPILQKDRGMSFGQDLYILGLMNEAAAIQTRDGKYADAAQAVFERGLELSPNRPQDLQGLLDIYRIKGELQNAKRIAEQILRNWPDDKKTRDMLARIDAAIQNGK